MDFPSGWEVANSPQQVVAKAPGADVFMLLQLVPGAEGRPLADVALTSMRNAGFRPVRQGERATINGLDAFVGLYEGFVEGLGEVAGRVAHIAHGGNAYMLAGLVAPSAFSQAEPAFETAIRSFRPLTAAEAAAIRPHRIDLYVVRSGDTWASIAERSDGIIGASTLAIMNNSAPDVQPAPGARIKIAVEG